MPKLGMKNNQEDKPDWVRLKLLKKDKAKLLHKSQVVIVLAVNEETGEVLIKTNF